MLWNWEDSISIRVLSLSVFEIEDIGVVGLLALYCEFSRCRINMKPNSRLFSLEDSSSSKSF